MVLAHHAATAIAHAANCDPTLILGLLRAFSVVALGSATGLMLRAQVVLQLHRWLPEQLLLLLLPDGHFLIMMLLLLLILCHYCLGHHILLSLLTIQQVLLGLIDGQTDRHFLLATYLFYRHLNY